MTSDQVTKQQLLERAKRAGHDVTARMSEQALQAVLDGDDERGATGEGGRVSADDRDRRTSGGPASRADAFRRLARARAAGEMVLLPRALRGDDRRIHVRQTIREDHELRIARHDEETAGKFDKLAGSRFSFFRGTALLFYRDMAGEDPWSPTVLAAGDIHPENFGVMPNADNVPIFGINDYDEVFTAPFTWDLKRGATGFVIAADEIGGLGRKHRRRIAEAFVRGYVDRITAYAGEEDEESSDLRRDNAPKLIRKLIDSATSGGREAWLIDDYYDEPRRGFRSSRKLVPVSSRRDEFQALIDRYVEESRLRVPARAGGMRVKDVAERRNQGTASLGLTRYYVMLEGEHADATDDILLELKQARSSALEGLVPPSEYEVHGAADRVAHGQRVQLVSGDLFYGSVEHDGVSFLVRERSSFRDDIDLDDLDDDGWREYARICGGVVAHAHALSDEAGVLDHDVEPEIVAAIGIEDLFVDDIVRFAEEAAQRNRQDHERYREDHALGAFRSVDVVYR